MLRKIKKAAMYLLPKDIVNIVFWVAVLWYSQAGIAMLFGLENAPAMSMGFIQKVLAGISGFAIILMASWIMYKMFFSILSDYFDDPDGKAPELNSEFVNDINAIRNTPTPPLKCYARPLFFLLFYFVLVATVIIAVSIQF